MSASTMTTSDLDYFLPSDATLFKHVPMQGLVRFSVALIILTALIAPDCCLTRSHVHGGRLDGLGPLCFSRAIER